MFDSLKAQANALYGQVEATASGFNRMVDQNSVTPTSVVEYHRQYKELLSAHENYFNFVQRVVRDPRGFSEKFRDKTSWQRLLDMSIKQPLAAGLSALMPFFIIGAVGLLIWKGPEIIKSFKKK
jgi:hypothetical protein